MDSNTDTSYQDDILKVKQIWNDLKDVAKSSHKKPQSGKPIKKHENNKVLIQGSKSPNSKQKSHKNKSQINLNQKPQQPETIITFSTQKTQPIQDQIHPNSSHQPNPTLHSKYIDNFNYRSAIQQKDVELSLLRVTNQRLKDQIDRLQNQLQQKNQLILKFKHREDELLGVTRKFSSEKIQALTKSVQYANYKNDSRRLLNMLQATEEYKQFAKIAIDDDGVRRLTMTGKKSKLEAGDGFKTDKRLHFCTCNKEFIPQDNFWVPQKVYDFSRDFVKQRKGECLSQAEVELLLYELNKMWREREKRIINWVKSQKALEVGKYKRKVEAMRRQGKEEQKQ